MLILTKTVDNIEDLKSVVPNENGCEFIHNDILDIVSNVSNDDGRYNYKDLVRYALSECVKEIPSPFSSLYPACYGLNLGNDYFLLRIPNKYGFGVKVIPTKVSIKYEISLVFYNANCFVEQSDYYKTLLDNGWAIKPKKNK